MTSDDNKNKFTSDSTERVRTVSKGVNLKTGEGMRESFDSWEDMDEYFAALIAEDYDNELDEAKDDKEPRTFWNYRVLEEVKDGISSFSIIEVYYEKGKIWAYIDSHHNILSGWDNYNDLKWTLEHIKDALDSPVVKKDENNLLYEDK